MSKKLVKGVENIIVNLFDNGFSLEYSGRDDDEAWVNTKLIVADFDTLVKEIKKAVELK